MGITEDIRKAIQSKVLIRYNTQEQDSETVSCVICGKSFSVSGPLCLYVRGDGHMCHVCAERFAPEMLQAMKEYRNKDVRKLLGRRETINPQLLTRQEWKEIRDHLKVLIKVTVDLARGISRGIIEAPSGHIGLLYLAKDISKPQKKEDESDKDYELRVKTYRTSRLFEKIKKETYDRIIALQHYFVKLGLPNSTDDQQQ